MNTQMIMIQEFCRQHKVEEEFIDALQEEGLLAVHIQDNRKWIEEEDLLALQQLCHWHYELDINIAGLETITHLLRKMKNLQREIQQLRQLESFLRDWNDVEND